MANAPGNYDVTFFAREAVSFLRNQVGLSRRVYLGYDREKRSARRGSKVEIRKPMSFVAGNAPTATATDLVPENISLTVDQHKDVVFLVTDKERALTEEQMRTDHVEPAMVAIVDAIETYLLSFYYKALNEMALAGGTAAVVDITEARRLLQLSKCPIGDVANMFLMMNPLHEKEWLDIAAFTQWQGAGPAGASSQMSGTLGQRYGFNPFSMNITHTHVASVSTDSQGAVDLLAGYPKGTSVIAVDAFGASDVYRKGQTFQFAGHEQRYALTADVTMTTGASAAWAFYPPLVAAVADDEVITVTSKTGGAAHDFPSGPFSLAFHRNWLALAFAPLEQPSAGARSSVFTDQETGISVRATEWYEGKETATYVRVDALYGAQVLDGNLACRLHETVT